MQAQNTQLCIHCNRTLRGGAMQYLLSDMAVEMLAWVEMKLKHEVNEQSRLCENCFTSFRSSWSVIQEPEVIADSKSTGLDPDPLLVQRCLTEEIVIKTEDDSKRLEHYDYKVEIDTSQPSYEEEPHNSQVNSKELYYEKKSNSDFEDDYKCVDDEKNLSDDDEQDMDESSSDDEAAKAMLSLPPLLSGSSLRSGTKCDSCRTVLTKQTYRKVPDGPEKDFFVVNMKGSRDVSPERVCNPCYIKAHTAVTNRNKIIKKSEPKENVANPDVPDDASTITIPGYRRFAKGSGKCIIQNCKGKDRLRIPNYLKLVFLKTYNIYTPDSARICSGHSKEYNIDWSFLKTQKYRAEFSAVDVEGMLDLLREEALKYPE